MAQVNNRDKSYLSHSLRLWLGDPSLSLVIRSQRPDKKINAKERRDRNLWQQFWPWFSEDQITKVTWFQSRRSKSLLLISSFRFFSFRAQEQLFVLKISKLSRKWDTGNESSALYRFLSYFDRILFLGEKKSKRTTLKTQSCRWNSHKN